MKTDSSHREVGVRTRTDDVASTRSAPDADGEVSTTTGPESPNPSPPPIEKWFLKGLIKSKPPPPSAECGGRFRRRRCSAFSMLLTRAVRYSSLGNGFFTPSFFAWNGYLRRRSAESGGESTRWAGAARNHDRSQAGAAWAQSVPGEGGDFGADVVLLAGGFLDHLKPAVVMRRQRTRSINDHHRSFIHTMGLVQIYNRRGGYARIDDDGCGGRRWRLRGNKGSFGQDLLVRIRSSQPRYVLHTDRAQE